MAIPANPKYHKIWQNWVGNGIDLQDIVTAGRMNSVAKELGFMYGLSAKAKDSRNTCQFRFYSKSLLKLLKPLLQIYDGSEDERNNDNLDYTSSDFYISNGKLFVRNSLLCRLHNEDIIPLKHMMRRDYIAFARYFYSALTIHTLNKPTRYGKDDRRMLFMSDNSRLVYSLIYLLQTVRPKTPLMPAFYSTSKDIDMHSIWFYQPSFITRLETEKFKFPEELSRLPDYTAEEVLKRTNSWLLRNWGNILHQKQEKLSTFDTNQNTIDTLNAKARELTGEKARLVHETTHIDEHPELLPLAQGRSKAIDKELRKIEERKQELKPEPQPARKKRRGGARRGIEKREIGNQKARAKAGE